MTGEPVSAAPAGVGAGIHVIPAVWYHGDPCAVPSLSASIANILLAQSPAHAREAHPRLNPNHKPTDDKKYDVGTCAHALLLEGNDVAVICDYPDWRTNAAKEERDAARAAGQIPLLAKDWDVVQAMVAAVREQAEQHEADPPLFTAGQPEQTLVWEEDGVTCRALVDWLQDDYTAITDLKTTSRSANPETWTRTLFGIGADVQVAMHSRGLEKLTGVRPAWRYVVVEAYPPYCMSVVTLAPSALALANEKLDYAISKWRDCLTSGDWPGYGNRVAHAELPTYLETQWFEREAREEVAA